MLAPDINRNRALSDWVDHIARYAQPDRVHWCDGSEAENAALIKQMLADGTLQTLNAQTLPREWDAAAGHQLQTGQAVPLAGFPEGDYRLEIKITDKLANKFVTRDVNFTVTPS